MDNFTCSDLSGRFAEPLAGTAPLATGWLLLEHSGPWSRTATDALAGDAAASQTVRRAASTGSVKTLLLRRPRHASSQMDTDRTSRAAFLVHAGPAPWCEELDPLSSTFADLDPEMLLRRRAPGIGDARTEPLFLVCTHAKRDRCCASLGRPIADTLAALHPHQTWECSHLGGHRFAGNMLVLPDGFAYGNLDVAAALDVVSSTRSGVVDAAHLRGRTWLDRAVQAADVWARRRSGPCAPDAVRIIGVSTAQESETDIVAVILEVGGMVHQLHVEHRRSGIDRRISCDTEEVTDPGEFVVHVLDDVTM